MSEQRWSIRRITRRDALKSGAAVGAGLAFGGTCIGQASAHSAAKRQDAKYTISFIQGVIADNFYVTMDCGARAKAETLGVTIDTQGPERFDATLQTPILNAVVQSKPDAIMIAPNDKQAMIAPIQAAIEAGIPVFCVDTTISSDIQLADIATDNAEGGRLAARGLAEAIGNTGKVFVVNVKPGISTTDLREQGFAEGIKEFPDIQYLGQEYCDDDPTIAAQVTSARLQSDPDLAGIFGTNLFAAEGAAAAVREQGKQGQIKIVGFDAGPTQVQDLRTEVVDILIAQHPGEIGEIAVQLIFDYLESEQKPDPKELVTGASIVTRDNLEDPTIAKYLYLADCKDYSLSNATPTAASSPTAGTPAP